MQLANGLLTSALGVISVVVFIVVVPVVAFYLLLDWDHMVARVDRAGSARPCAHSAASGARD